MARQKQLELARGWFEKAQGTQDPFDRFYSLWIALVAAANYLRTNSGFPFRANESDRELVVDYFKARSDMVCDALRMCEPNMVRVARRRGSHYRDPVVDTGNPELREKLRKLGNHYAGGQSLSREELAEFVAELLNRVRNNLLHGEKDYDDQGDRELLELVNPVLSAILCTCEPRLQANRS